MTTSIEAMQLEAANQRLAQAQTVLIVTHVRPDGDAIGSMLGLANAIRTMGKTVTAAVDEGVPEMFSFLPGADQVVGKLFKGQWDLMISTDASDEERTGAVGQYGRANSLAVINLDHHATNTGFGDVHIVDPNAVSAAEVAFRWLHSLMPIADHEVAAPLLTGMVTDTIGFRTSNVTAETLTIVQQLMGAGASLTEITQRTLDRRSIVGVNLWKRALATMELHAGGIVTAKITRSDMKQAGLVTPSDEGLVGFLVNVDEAMVAVVFREDDDGINISMRAKNGYDVSGVAFALGGGGHKQAAGATVPGQLEAVEAQVLPLLREAVRNGKLTLA